MEPAVSSAVAVKNMSNQSKLASAQVEKIEAETERTKQENQKFKEAGSGGAANITDTVEKVLKRLLFGETDVDILPHGGLQEVLRNFRRQYHTYGQPRFKPGDTRLAPLDYGKWKSRGGR